MIPANELLRGTGSKTGRKTRCRGRSSPASWARLAAGAERRGRRAAARGRAVLPRRAGASRRPLQEVPATGRRAPQHCPASAQIRALLKLLPVFFWEELRLQSLALPEAGENCAHQQRVRSDRSAGTSAGLAAAGGGWRGQVAHLNVRKGTKCPKYRDIQPPAALIPFICFYSHIILFKQSLPRLP